MHSWLKSTAFLLMLPSLMSAADSAAFPIAPALADVPAGRLHDDLAALAAPARAKALARLAGVPAADARSLRSHADGELWYHCAALDHGTRAADDATSASLKLKAAGRAAVPINSPPVFHSKRGSRNVIYLDFNGATVSGTEWNTDDNVTTYVAKPYSIDSDLTTFSDLEQAAIFTVWDRVAEDYSSFDIDVTTEAPSTFTDTTAWVVITPTTDANGKDLPHKGAGGIAILDVFGKPNYHSTNSPVWVTDMAAYSIADAASHEVGHNLGLKHDGIGTSEYAGGFAATPASPSWGPIMGAPYGMTLSQWSKGEYTGATNSEDDLAIISGKLGYLADDNGNTTATASSLRATNNLFAVNGKIERTGDVDVFQVNLKQGDIIILAVPHVSSGSTSGGNLDIKLTLLSSTSTELFTSNPLNATGAQIAGTINQAGTFFLKVEGVASGNPMGTPPNGATNYGCLGQYALFSGAPPGTTTSGGTTSGVTTGGATGGTPNPVTDPGTGGGTTSGGTPTYSAAQPSSAGHCGLGGGALALIATCALALWTASRRR